MSDSFNKDLDKITEYEVIFDFLNRLSVGKDINITSSNNNKLAAGTSVPLLLQRIFENVPSSLADQYGHLKRIRMVTTAGLQSATATVSGSWQLVKAYSENSGLELSNTITRTSSNGNTIFSHYVDTPYITSDVINLYVKQ